MDCIAWITQGIEENIELVDIDERWYEQNPPVGNDVAVTERGIFTGVDLAKTLLERPVRNNSLSMHYLACYNILWNLNDQVVKSFQMKYHVLLRLKCNVMITLPCSKASKSPASSLIFILIVSNIFCLEKHNVVFQSSC